MFLLLKRQADAKTLHGIEKKLESIAETYANTGISKSRSEW